VLPVVWGILRNPAGAIMPTTLGAVAFSGDGEHIARKALAARVMQAVSARQALSSGQAEGGLEQVLKSAVFFSGGDQLRITSQIGDTPIDERVHEIYETGGVIAGTSAGASVMSDTMMVKGPNAASFRIGHIRMAPGLGLLPNVIIDQHFAERGRIGRLIGAVSQNPRVLGIGIDEDTAIVVKGEMFKVIGSGAIWSMQPA
jgi:cyanophycinase